MSQDEVDCIAHDAEKYRDEDEVNQVKIKDVNCSENYGVSAEM